jgi:hypothetical protein
MGVTGCSDKVLAVSLGWLGGSSWVVRAAEEQASSKAFSGVISREECSANVPLLDSAGWAEA